MSLADDQKEDISLANMCMGGVIEQFDFELKKVLNNILDPNTTGAAREITLKVKIKPDQDRGFGAVDIDVKSKLAPMAPMQTKMFIAIDKNGACATEYNPKQGVLDLDIKPRALADVRTIGDKK